MSLLDRINKVEQKIIIDSTPKKPEEPNYPEMGDLPTKKDYPEKPEFVETPKYDNLSNWVLKIASGFSIIFGMSLLSIIETVNIQFLLIGAFLLFVLIGNEYGKVKSLVNYFTTKSKIYLSISILTILVSLVSVYGIYNSVNKQEELFKSNKQKVEKQQETYIEKRQVFIDSLNNLNEGYYNDIRKNLSKIEELTLDQHVYRKQRENVQQVLEKKNLFLEKKISRNDKLISQYSNEIDNVDKTIKTDEELEKGKAFKMNVLAGILSLISFLVELVIVGLCWYNVKKNKEYDEKVKQIKQTNKDNDNEYKEVCKKIDDEHIELCQNIQDEYDDTCSAIRSEYEQQLQTYNQHLLTKEKEYNDKLLNNPHSKEFKKVLGNTKWLYKTKSIDDKLTKKEIEFLCNLKDKKDVDKLYNLYKTLQIINDARKGVRLLVTEKKAIELIDQYYTEKVDDFMLNDE